VLQQLREKHPEAQEAKLGSLLFGPVEDFPDSIYQQIYGNMIREAALRTKDPADPRVWMLWASRESLLASLSGDQVLTYATLLLY